MPTSANMAQPRHPASQLVRDLLAQGLSLCEIRREVLERTGGTISRPTILKIKHKRAQQSASLYGPAEVRLRVAVLCPRCRAYIAVLPCRVDGWRGPDATEADS